ncbi:adenylate/guanylate cyclase domain-containing protein [Patulibacter sp.]|uniref:CHASE2 domain-containing protein n=1 Tax=Patulibacter sp. TaxID=1912859 RepID=UPI002721E4FB|nr:adenylate/guanylate cyclase domain-containing protein [Patulibacter sp.]MDO9410424.1 adenylate/guanylate cyclase domain-containing protein [Patulibacter sp.]
MAVVSAVVAVALGALGALTDLERSTVDARFELRGTDRDRIGPVPIAVVGIDDRTLRRVGERFPFSRRFHARVLDRLREAGARAVAYDVEFTEQTTTADDNALIEAVAAVPRIVLAGFATDDRGDTAVLGGAELQREIGVRVGHVGVVLDGDGVLRRFAAVTARLTGFPVAVAERATGRRVDRSRFDDDGEALVDWVGGDRAIPTYSFSDVMDGAVAASRLRGRIVVVGATAPSLKDVRSTPMDGGAPLSGPEIQANAIATVLRGVPLRESAWPLGLLLTALAAVGPALAARRGRSFGTLLAAAAGTAVLLGIAWVAFLLDRVVPVAEPLVALGLGTLGAVAAGSAFEAGERRRTREIFARFVSHDVVDDVLAHTDAEVRLGGVRVDATILFCDLRGSTALLEDLEPERGIAVLNRFLGAMGDCVDGHGGTLVGYRGDGLMAVFGAPLEQPDHADRAVACAREMAGPALDRCHALLRADGVERELRLGVGLASGPVMAGNVGSERRMEYTAIGDAANVSARLEGLTKDHGRAILVAAGTVERLPDATGLQPLGPVALRGRVGTVEVWAAG